MKISELIKAISILILIFSISIHCDNTESTTEENSAASDTTTGTTTPTPAKPVVGNNGLILVSLITSTTITVNWTKATDDVSAQANLQYLVYFSTSNNIDTLANIEANGTPVGTYRTTNEYYGSASPNSGTPINTNVTGLSDTSATRYYFNMIAKDEAGNKRGFIMETLSSCRIPFIATFKSCLSTNPPPLREWPISS